MCFETDARPPPPPIRGAAVDGRSLTLGSRDGTRFSAYAARAERPSPAGVVVIPDVRGLHPYYEELALHLAEAGVNAVAIDLYARTAGTGERGEGFEYEPHVRQVRIESLTDDVAAAVDHLRGPQGGESSRIYTLGFCLGGRISFLQATAGHGLAGVIGFYGWPVGEHRSGLPAPADEAARFSCPVLAIYGGADERIPHAQREAFDRALEAAGITHRTIVYDGAPHSFFDRRAEEHADASEGAWREVLTFMGVM